LLNGGVAVSRCMQLALRRQARGEVDFGGGRWHRESFAARCWLAVRASARLAGGVNWNPKEHRATERACSPIGPSARLCRRLAQDLIFELRREQPVPGK
jgi:hypothetical protein